jgi:hypothetical protein
MNHERNKAQVAYLSAMELAPSQEGAPLVTLGVLTQKLLAGGALLHRRARPTSGERAPSHEGAPFSIAKGSFKCCSQGALSFLRERAPSQESVPLLRRAHPSCPGGSSRIDQAKIRHNFCMKNECRSQGAGTQFVHKE